MDDMTHFLKNGNQLLSIVSRGSNILGYLVIDSLVAGRSCGGLRLLPDVDEWEMRQLARAMTLKYGFLGLPQGGAKAGVRGDPEGPLTERRKRLMEFGEAIAPLLQNRIYVPGTDMGTDIDDIRYMLKGVGVPIKYRELRKNDSGYYTAVSVFTSIKQAVRHLRKDLSKCTIAIEGYGKVGSALAGLLQDIHVRVVAVSTSKGAIYNPQGLDIKVLTELTANAGSQAVNLYTDAKHIEPKELLELPVDILCPCARHASVNRKNADLISAHIICSGSNNPVTPEAEAVLSNKGVLCLPDFVTNCGGVLGGTMEFASIRKNKIARFIDGNLGSLVARLLEKAESQNLRPRVIATRLSWQRSEEVRRRAARPTPLAKLFSLMLSLYRRGLIPGPIVAHFSLPYFRNLLTLDI
ncbi:MAG: Glu/Leu/Phe/Val dehydrogenase [Deltaproteobacteria bacterium]|nr:Glu/Leu/Phe/Val dehydrogenase [Deltaproteobacteria bacterium]